MSYLAKWVSEVKEGHTITADDAEVLARVQQALLASDKHHQQARDAQANEAETSVVNAAGKFSDTLDYYDYVLQYCGEGNAEQYLPSVKFAEDNLRAAVAHLLAVEDAS